MRRHTRKWKEVQLQEIKKLLEEYPVIAIADIDRFPANLLQQLKKNLSGKAIIKVSKARVIAKALSEAKFPKEFIEYAQGSIAVVFSKENPFELYALIKKNEGKAPAKPGMIAPQDIVVPKGDTGLPPGPALSDLKRAGLDVRIEGSTIVIPQDTVVTKEGEEITPEIADALSKLDIKPISLRLNIMAAIENGQIFSRDILDINPQEVEERFINAYRDAINLAFNVAYPTKETIELLLARAINQARNLAFNAEILEKEVVEFLVQKASLHAKALEGLIKEDNVAEKTKAEKPEEGKNNEGEAGQENSKVEEQSTQQTSQEENEAVATNKDAESKEKESDTNEQ